MSNSRERQRNRHREISWSETGKKERQRDTYRVTETHREMCLETSKEDAMQKGKRDRD